MKWTYLLVSLAYLVACGSESAETRERVTDAATSDLTSGAAAELVKVSYKARAVEGVSGATCDYDRSWLEVANLAEPVRSSLNAALNRDPRTAVDACKTASRFEGGYTNVVANSHGVLSLVYRFDTAQRGAHDTEATPVNLDLATGKFITLSSIVNKSGRERLVASCTSQSQKVAAAAGFSDVAVDEACREALTLYPGEDSEHFSVSAAGIFVHIEAHVPLPARTMIPSEGLLIPWSELRVNLLDGPATRLAN